MAATQAGYPLYTCYLLSRNRAQRAASTSLLLFDTSRLIQSSQNIADRLRLEKEKERAKEKEREAAAQAQALADAAAAASASSAVAPMLDRADSCIFTTTSSAAAAALAALAAAAAATTTSPEQERAPASRHKKRKSIVMTLESLLDEYRDESSDASSRDGSDSDDNDDEDDDDVDDAAAGAGGAGGEDDGDGAARTTTAAPEAAGEAIAAAASERVALEPEPSSDAAIVPEAATATTTDVGAESDTLDIELDIEEQIEEQIMVVPTSSASVDADAALAPSDLDSAASSDTASAASTSSAATTSNKRVPRVVAAAARAAAAAASSSSELVEAAPPRSADSRHQMAAAAATPATRSGASSMIPLAGSGSVVELTSTGGSVVQVVAPNASVGERFMKELAPDKGASKMVVCEGRSVRLDFVLAPPTKNAEDGAAVVVVLDLHDAACIGTLSLNVSQYLPSTRIFDSAPSVPVVLVGLSTANEAMAPPAIAPKQIKSMLALSRALVYVDGMAPLLPALARLVASSSYFMAHPGRESMLAKVVQTAESGLHELSLRKLELELVPNQLLYCRYLRKLRLSNNALRFFPSLLLELPNLVHLDLANNLIADIPTDITLLRHLQILDLTNNRITSVPNKELSSMRALKELKLRGNPVDEKEAVGRLKKRSNKDASPVSSPTRSISATSSGTLRNKGAREKRPSKRMLSTRSLATCLEHSPILIHRD